MLGVACRAVDAGCCVLYAEYWALKAGGCMLWKLDAGQRDAGRLMLGGWMLDAGCRAPDGHRMGAGWAMDERWIGAGFALGGRCMVR